MSPNGSERIRTAMWSALIAFQVMSGGSYSILVHLSHSSAAEAAVAPFRASVMNLSIELLKLLISAALCWATAQRQQQQQQQQMPLFVKTTSSSPWRSSSNSLVSSWRFALPALLYFVNNNLAVHIQSHMDATSYQMMSNLKILTTCLLYKLVINKHVSRVKWLAIAMLFVAGVCYTLANLTSEEEDNSADGGGRRHHNDRIYITYPGLALMAIYCTISGFSGVYSEVLLKGNYVATSLHVQNVYLYAYGTLFNTVASLLSSEHSSSWTSLLDGFNGFNVYTWLIVATQTVNGLLMSVVMKHSSNLTRLFVIACSLIVTAFLSHAIFAVHLNFFFYSCFAITMLSSYLYILY